MDGIKALIQFLYEWANEFSEKAENIEKRLKELYHAKQEETKYEKEIEGIDDPEKQSEILEKYPCLAWPSGGVEMAVFSVNANTEEAIKTLKKAVKGLQSAIDYFNGGKIEPDKILEGDIESLRKIAALCAGLAAKMEAESQIKDQ